MVQREFGMQMEQKVLIRTITLYGVHVTTKATRIAMMVRVTFFSLEEMPFFLHFATALCFVTWKISVVFNVIAVEQAINITFITLCHLINLLAITTQVVVAIQ